jgi:hypothetical protein
MPNHIHVIPPSTRVMTWLDHHVPITLVADLADPEGPRSREILTYEAVADDVARDTAALSSQAADDVGQDFSGAGAAC